jgi:hypothetical protein
VTRAEALELSERLASERLHHAVIGSFYGDVEGHYSIVLPTNRIADESHLKRIIEIAEEERAHVALGRYGTGDANLGDGIILHRGNGKITESKAKKRAAKS